MIIKIGNVVLQPWYYDCTSRSWVRWVEYKSSDKVVLEYKNLGGRWYPNFMGSTRFLEPLFDEMAKFDNHKYKYHQNAMDQMDKFLIRMGKLTSFI